MCITQIIFVLLCKSLILIYDVFFSPQSTIYRRDIEMPYLVSTFPSMSDTSNTHKMGVSTYLVVEKKP